MAFPSLTNSLKIGQLLMIETVSEILIGNLKLIGAGGKIIELENVRDFKTNFVYTSSQILPLPQIKRIKIIQDEDDDNHEEEEEEGDSSQMTSDSKPSLDSTGEITTSTPLSPTSTSTTSLLPEKPQRRYLRNIDTHSTCVNHSKPLVTSTNGKKPSAAIQVNLSNRELLHIQEQLENIVYIYQTDNNYHCALADIKTQPVISLILEPMEYGRHLKTSLIVIGTNRAVYVFDIFNLGKIFRELKDILESKSPRKALHDGRRILDNLQHRQNIELGGVFDTFVAHCLITGTKAPLNLVETVKLYYDISELYFTDTAVENLTAQTNNVYNNRPIPKSLLQLIAKKVIFQYKLYEYLLHEQMLGNFYKQCEQFNQTFSSNNDTVEVVMQMKPSSRQGYEHIEHHAPWKELLDMELK